MKFVINGTEYDLVPWQFENDLSSNRAARNSMGSYSNSPGSINSTRRYCQNVTGTASAGTFVNLKAIFKDEYYSRINETFTSNWEQAFTWENTASDQTVQSNTFVTRIKHQSGDRYLTFEYSKYDNPAPGQIDSFKIDYASEQYNYDYFLGIGTINNINAELALSASEIPMFDPTYNGVHDVVLLRSSYIPFEAYKSGNWEYGSFVMWDESDEAGRPLSTNTIESNIPYNRTDNTGALGSGDYSHRLFIWDYFQMDFSFDEYNGYHDLKFNNVKAEDIAPDPEDPNDDINHPSGPPGVYRDTSDPIGRPGLPTTSALSTGFIKAYKLSAANAQALSAYMLTDSFVQGVKKLMANPIDYVIGFHMIPVNPYCTSHNIIIGGVDTQISADMITSEYMNYSCGSIKVPEYWGSFIDYAPCTKAEIYVPFIGVCPVDIDDIMNATLTLEYNINVLSGACTAYLHCNTARTLKSTVYYWNGNMQSQIPITNKDYSEKVNAAMGAVGNLISAGMGANPGGNVMAAVGNVAEATLKKPTIQKSGVLAGDVGMLSEFTPFLIISRPVQALPKNYRALNGNTSMIGGTVGSYSGYVEIEEVQLSGIACTDAERSEILQLLQEGVYV